jgi:hypothetical protein
MINEEMAYKIAKELYIPKWQVDEAIKKHGINLTLKQLRKEEKEMVKK